MRNMILLNQQYNIFKEILSLITVLGLRPEHFRKTICSCNKLEFISIISLGNNFLFTIVAAL